MKIQIKSNKFQSFAGLFFPLHEIRRIGLSSLIDSELGIRAKSVGYSYSEIIESLFAIFYCGGDCIEDIHSHLRDDLCLIPGFRFPSPDTLLRGIKELSTENTDYSSKQQKHYKFNVNQRMNSLMIRALLQTKQLQKGASYDFDYDNQLIPTEKYDALYSYKKCFGYFPGIATVGDKIVYIENRDGNANVRFKQEDTLQRAYELLEAEGVKVNRSRMDCGSYSKEIIDMVDKHSKRFYIRARKSHELYNRIGEISKWEKVEINELCYEVASIGFTSFSKEKKYRLVIAKENTKDLQADLFTGDTCKYRSILTNDWESSEQEVIQYYNQRGASEKIFDQMNNDFGWSKLPCSFQNENTVFMILTAMIKNFFSYLMEKYAKVCKHLTPTCRLKRFIFQFVTVVGKWIYQARSWKLILYTKRSFYEKLLSEGR